MRGFRFSFNICQAESKEDFAKMCRRSEEYGYDVVLTADHLGMLAPFPALVAAADATDRLRVGTLVLNTSFWNPALLAREILSTDLLTDGRLEVGLGASHMRWQFDEAGIPWEPIATRADRLASTVSELERHFTTEVGAPPEARGESRAVQQRGFHRTGPPLLIGGVGDRVLRIAAEHADIVSISGVHQMHGKPAGMCRLGSAAEAADRVRFVREHAGARSADLEWHMLAHAVEVTDDRRAAAEKLLKQLGMGISVEDALETPYLLIGTVDEIAEQLVTNRERYGFSYITVHQPYIEAFAPVIDKLRGS
ncbi:LLM class F420-dependent oxidoreductase [Streptomyces sp. TRM68416]|uniref:LLM class F420-dependent oxidoreductase n=1 Tax=Streptomyces sp. TRM68416 TaxID=2758412 RepID=UPI001661FF5E|nr:LLM class F420-dependent oxidoreductase [Streptomyces sp. TRM68416]MBD0839918.1 LLM class F420-dependent oxidoreductase [Streptomyces sp. TRM68416]